MYSIAIDAGRKLVRAKLAGFLSAEEAQAFARDEQAAIRDAGWASGEYLVLVDTSECTLQLQEVVAHLKALVTTSEFRARRVALVNGQSSFRMQGRRILDRENAVICETTEEAEAWLFRP